MTNEELKFKIDNEIFEKEEFTKEYNRQVERAEKFLNDGKVKEAKLQLQYANITFGYIQRQNKIILELSKEYLKK